MKGQSYKVFARLFFSFSLFITIVLFIHFAFPFIYPFIIAFIIASLLLPIIKLIEERWKLPRSLLTIVFIFSLILVTISGFYFGLRYLIHEISIVFHLFHHELEELRTVIISFLQNNLIPSIDRTLELIPFIKDKTNWQVEQAVNRLVETILAHSHTIITTILQAASQLVASFTSILVIGLFIIILLYFFMTDFELLIARFKRVVPNHFVKKIEEVILYLKHAFLGFLKAQVMLTLISSVLIFILLYFFQFQHAFALSVLIFFIDLFPYIGIGIIFLPWMFVALLQAKYVTTIQLGVIYGLIIVLQQVLEPKLLAKQIGLHPLVTLFILFITVKLYGIFGLLLAPLFLIIISAIYQTKILHFIYRYIKHG